MKPICLSGTDKTTELIRENLAKKCYKALQDSVLDEKSITVFFRIATNHLLKHPPTKADLREYQGNVMSLLTFDQFLEENKGAKRK